MYRSFLHLHTNCEASDYTIHWIQSYIWDILKKSSHKNTFSSICIIRENRCYYEDCQHLQMNFHQSNANQNLLKFCNNVQLFRAAPKRVFLCIYRSPSTQFKATNHSSRRTCTMMHILIRFSNFPFFTFVPRYMSFTRIILMLIFNNCYKITILKYIPV